MAPHADRLADIGREGFTLVERFGRWGMSAYVPKDQHNVFHDKEYRDAPISSNENVINSKKAAEKYGGVVAYRVAPNSRDENLINCKKAAPNSSNENVINSKKAAEIYGGVVVMEYYNKRFVGRRQ